MKELSCGEGDFVGGRNGNLSAKDRHKISTSGVKRTLHTKANFKHKVRMIKLENVSGNSCKFVCPVISDHLVLVILLFVNDKRREYISGNYS